MTSKDITNKNIAGAVVLIINGQHIIVEVKISRSTGY